MESKTYLGRYIVMLDPHGQPLRLPRHGRGVTCKAFDAETKREVALDLLPAASMRESLLTQWQAEARAAQQLQNLHIPLLYDFGVEQGHLVSVSEVVEGSSALRWVQTQGPLPLATVLHVGAQVVNALAAAAFYGLFHRALNPRHLIFCSTPAAGGDWPLVKVLHFLDPLTAAPENEAAEDVDFTSPEQLAAGTVDFRSEIYSLGCTLWFLLTGAPPANGAATVEKGHRLPAAVRDLLAQMLALDPAERLFDPLALAEQIRVCQAELGPEEEVVLPPEPVEPALLRPPRRRFPWQPFAVAAVVLALLAGAASFFPQIFPRHHDRPLGVPIGIPEEVANAATSAPAPAPATGVLESTARAEDVPNDSAATIAAQPLEEPARVTQEEAAPAPPAPVAPSDWRSEAETAPAIAAPREEVRKAEPVAPEPEPPAEAPRRPRYAAHSAPPPAESALPARAFARTPEGEIIYDQPMPAPRRFPPPVSRAPNGEIIYEPAPPPVLPALPVDE